MAKPLKYGWTGLLTVILFFFCSFSYGQTESTIHNNQDTEETESEGRFDANSVILEHVQDSHFWHFFSINGHPVSIALPVIIYIPQSGFSVFMSSKFHHGEKAYHGFRIMTEAYIEKYDLDKMSYFPGRIIPVNADGSPDFKTPIYDISLTKNVLQAILSLLILALIFIGVAKKYKRNPNKAPSGFQNAVEPIIIFIRDEVARAYLGEKADKYLPLLLTLFFFIWINSLLALIPGSTNVAGNLAFTGALALFSFIYILLSTNKHYWIHITWPPGIPIWVKPILVPVEILGIFTKPFALMIRLFANMLAGHMIILSIISMIFIFGGMLAAVGWGFSIVSVGFTIFMYFVELLVGLIQAFIFANLTALFIAQAFENGPHEEFEEEIVV